MDKGEVVAHDPVEAVGEAAEVLELVEAAFDAVAEPVDERIVGIGALRERVEWMTAGAPIWSRWRRRLLAS